MDEILGLPIRSMDEGTRIMAQVAHYDGAHHQLDLRQLLVWVEYLTSLGAGYHEVEINILIKLPMPQVEAEQGGLLQALPSNRTPTPS